ncbi:MAG: hypothetical protein JRM80_00090 [Nitrososphaerota archaeon]|nr:hypothetical protein [Nitrososphaerota archaeon]
MTSPRRRQDRPVESVTLKITFKAKEVEAAKIMEAVPSAVKRGGLCEVKIEADEPAEAAERARALLERLRAAA